LFMARSSLLARKKNKVLGLHRARTCPYAKEVFASICVHLRLQLAVAVLCDLFAVSHPQ
jgi:hypothetical protein